MFASMSPDYVHDIQELCPDKRSLLGAKYRSHLHRVARAAIWITYLYFPIRFLFILTTPEPTWKMWLMFGIECLFAHMSYQHQSLSLAATSSPHHISRKQLRLPSSERLPTVDILVTCCGEPVDVVLDTVRAACVVDYPIPCFRVRLLDDGASPELRDEVAKLSMKWKHLSYHTRGKQSGQSFAKAGNLNYALFSLQTQDPPEFCTVVDADSILMPEFLRATLPHLLQDPEVALLTTRQYFYNLPRGDPLSQSRAYFYTCENTELDLLGHALDAGSGAVFRRKAIVAAGGYPTYSFSEDWQLSLVLRGLGQRTIQVQEALQYGLVPTSLAGHLKQRNRWHIGHSQQVSFYFAPVPKAFPKAPRNPIPEILRRDIALGGLSIMTGLVTYVIGYAAVPFHLFCGGDLIPNGSSFVFKVQIVLATAHVLSVWAYDWCRSAHAGVPFEPFAHAENSWLAGAHLYAVARFHLLGSKPKGSFVTGSTANSNENAASITFSQKAYRDILGSGILFNLCLLIAIIAGFVFSIHTNLSGSGPVAPKLVVTTAWPPFLHLIFLAVANNWVPVSHLLSPPLYQSRDAGMVATKKGISYPRVAIEGEVPCEQSLFGLCCSVMVPITLLGALVGALMS